MGLIFGLIKTIIKLFIYFFIFAAIIVLIPNLPPYTSFTKIDLEPTLPRVGPLAPNNHLNNVEKLYTDKLMGPECFQLYKGEVYTSLATGEIVKLSPGGHVTIVTQIGKPCAGLKEEHICGRPLGFVIDEKKNLLYVADAYYGIWTVDLGSNKKTLLVSPHVEINGQKPKLFNSVALDSKGNLFYTVSTYEFPLYDGAFSMFTDPTGRLFQYNAAKNESKVLIEKLWFANGLVVSPDDDFIVVTETTAYRLVKYYLAGPKKGQKEVFVAGLPGSPDNLRVLPDGSGLQVALYVAHGEDDPIIMHSLAATPLARKFIVRVQYLIQTVFEFLNQQYSHVFFEDIIYTLGHFKSLSGVGPDSAGVVHIDWNGNIINSYFHTEGHIKISDAILYKNGLYLGQPHMQNFVAHVPAPPLFKKAFTPKEHKPQEKIVAKTEAPKTTQPPPTTTQKPTTTTPKPTTTTQKPTTTTQKPTTTTQKPTTTTQKPTTTTQKPTTTTPKPTTTTQKPTTTTQKPPTTTQKPTPPKVQTVTPKPVEVKSPPPAKPAAETKAKDQKPQAKVPSPTAKPVEQAKPEAAKEKVPKQIPITEEIPSDTAKPSKETLKVIKKAGPAEIPNPEL